MRRKIFWGEQNTKKEIASEDLCVCSERVVLQQLHANTCARTPKIVAPDIISQPNTVTKQGKRESEKLGETAAGFFASLCLFLFLSRNDDGAAKANTAPEEMSGRGLVRRAKTQP